MNLKNREIPLRIMVMGTRGKSSLIAAISGYLQKNGYKVLSRQTGLIPVVTFDNQSFYLKRSKSDNGFDRTIETKIVLDHFNRKFKIDALVIENNAISEYHMSKLSQYLKPHLTIITTISPDHVLDQGIDPEQTARIYLHSTYSKTKIVFWTNHQLENEQMRRTAHNLRLKFPMLYGPLSERNKQILQLIPKLLNKEAKLRPFQETKTDIELLKDEMITGLENGKVLINLGSINDLLHTQIFIDEVQKKYEGPYYLLLNFREDREDRTWIYMNYILPQISKSFDGVIVRSDHPAFTENYIRKYVAEHYPRIVCIPTPSFKDFREKVIKMLPDNSKIIILGNTANDFGFDVIQHYHLFQESYPVLKKVKISALN